MEKAILCTFSDAAFFASIQQHQAVKLVRTIVELQSIDVPLTSPAQALYTPVLLSATPHSPLTLEMPKPNTIIAAPLREALFECFSAATRLVRPELRRQIILVSGAASVAHSSLLKTEDVDVAAPPSIIITIWKGVLAGALDFHLDPDGKISFDTSFGFRVRLNLIQIGAGRIERVHACEPFMEGSLASKSDLLRLRAVTVVDRE